MKTPAFHPAPMALLPVLLVVAIGTGCASSPVMRSESAAERLAEGTAFNDDRAFTVGPIALAVTGSEQVDLAKLHVAATEIGDHELALAAAFVMLETATPYESHAGWQLLARTVELSDGGIATAIAERRLELIAHVERQGGAALDIAAARLQDAVVRRSIAALERARSRFDEASWKWTSWGDDERGMQESMLHGLESHALGRTVGLSSHDMLYRLGAVSRAESDLYANQAAEVRSTWQDAVQFGQSRFVAALERAQFARESMQGSWNALPSWEEQDGGIR